MCPGAPGPRFCRVNSPGLAIAIMVAGVLAALVGAAMSARAARRAVAEDGPTARSDIAVAVLVFGIAAVLFGAGDMAYLLLAQL